MRVAFWCAWMAFLSAVVIAGASEWVLRTRTQQVTVLSKLHDADMRRALLAAPPGAMPIGERLGVVEGPGPLECIVFDEARVLRPPEEPGSRLLHVDRAAGEGLLTARAVRGRRIYALVYILLCGLGCLFLSRVPLGDDAAAS